MNVNHAVLALLEKWQESVGEDCYEGLRMLTSSSFHQHTHIHMTSYTYIVLIGLMSV